MIPRRIRPFLGYFLAFVGIVSCALAFGLYSRSKQLKQPLTSQAALKTELTEIVLAVSSISEVDGQQDTVASALARTENELTASLESAKNLVSQQADALGETKVNDLTIALDEQQALLNTYTERYKLFGKALSYNPSLDLDGLDPDKSAEREQLQARATAARDNLAKLADIQPASQLTAERFNLSRSTLDNLNKVTDCFDQLAQATNSKPSLIKETIEECKQLYPSFRKDLVSDLTSIYRSDQAKQNIEFLSKLQNDL